MGYPKIWGLLPLTVLLLAVGPDRNAPAAVEPERLMAALEPGPLHDAIAQHFLQPYFDATATPPGLSPFDGTLAGLKSLSGPQAPDLALVNGAALEAGCAAQVFARLDWNTLVRSQYYDLAATDCGAGAYISATAVAYDQDKLHADPSWGDFWDVAKYPGRRGLRKAARGTLEIALMADGVAPGDVYKALRSHDGVDRAFRKLDQLKPYVEWWDQSVQPGQFLAAGKVLLTSAPANALPVHGKLHAGIHWGGCLLEVASWVIPRTAPHGQAAMLALQVASDPARQASFGAATRLGPATKSGFALLPAAARETNPDQPGRLQDCLRVDEGFWLENGDKLEARFSAWMGK